MGMFDKDKEYGRLLTSEFQVNEAFVLHACQVKAETVPTRLGEARQSILTVSRVDAPQEQFDVTTLASAIADKVDQAVPDDLPAVICWRTVDSSHGGTATVIQFLRNPTEAEAPIK